MREAGKCTTENNNNNNTTTTTTTNNNNNHNNNHNNNNNNNKTTRQQVGVRHVRALTETVAKVNGGRKLERGREAYSSSLSEDGSIPHRFPCARIIPSKMERLKVLEDLRPPVSD